MPFLAVVLFIFFMNSDSLKTNYFVFPFFSFMNVYSQEIGSMADMVLPIHGLADSGDQTWASLILFYSLL